MCLRRRGIKSTAQFAIQSVNLIHRGSPGCQHLAIMCFDSCTRKHALVGYDAAWQRSILNPGNDVRERNLQHRGRIIDGQFRRMVWNPFGICRIVLLCLHVGLHVGRRHEPDLMAQLLDRAGPMMRGRRRRRPRPLTGEDQSSFRRRRSRRAAGCRCPLSTMARLQTIQWRPGVV